MSKNVLAFFLATILVSGCGGGGGSSVPRRPAILPQIPLQTPAHAPQAPITDLDGSLRIGADVAAPKARLVETGARNEVSVSSGRVRDGAGTRDVIEYLHPRTTEGNAVGLRTFEEPSVVGVAVGTSARFTDNAVRAVQIVNAALPYEKRLSFSLIPAPDPETILDVPEGSIIIEFIPQAEWPYEAKDSYIGLARQRYFARTDPRTGRREVVRASRAHVLIDSAQLASYPEERTIRTIVHELLHAVGFAGHVDPQRFPNATLKPHTPRNFTGYALGKIDGEALLAAYGRFSPGELPEDISVESLGLWSDTSFHIRGDLRVTGGEVSFGVASRNDLAQPWAQGPTPWTNLADNEELTGTATWIGVLLGIASSARVVVGDSELTVDLADFDGRLDFTNLQFDGGGTWGDGDLGYSIGVRGNTFVQTGGDAGEVTGAFFGPEHEGMGGVLERSDLSAAFGGKR